MPRHSYRPSRCARLVAFPLLSVILALGVCSCQTTASPDITGSLGETAEPGRPADPRREADSYRERYRANPKDPAIAMQYARALRAAGERSQAVAVLEQATLANPGSKALLAAYGRALADNGNFQLAFDVLSRAHTPEDPDWRILSVQGAALDQLGRYEEARQYYDSALKIAPDEPSVLSNLGLSYLLSKDLPHAEEASDKDPRVRMNLAVVLGLEGRLGDAENLAKADLPVEQATANLAELKRLLSKKDNAHSRGADHSPPAKAAHPG